ncbi:MAG: monomethylamine:corrinoid methyltransferase [Thermoanaerobacteraceae bacterium]|nr:monomethylamine:corrinoid methyltransferase [Thermoanaerobacteraceae bacterium]
MLSFVEIMERAETGPYMAEADFDLQLVAATARRLAREYGLRFRPEEVVPEDEKQADALYAAGLDMAVAVGLYCRSTSRVMQFTREEIERALHMAPREITVGQGRDSRLLFARRPDDSRYPVVFGGNAGAPIPEELYLATVLSYAREPLIDGLDHGAIVMVDGREVRTGSPLEITATRRELSFLRQGITRCGRPGMPLIAAESSGTSLGDLAVAHPDYLRTCDIHLVPILSELKTDYHNLAKVANFVEYGGYNGNLPNPMVGGYAGGPEATAVATMAAFMLGVLVNQAHLHLCHPVHIRYTSTSTPEVMWVINLVGRAFARHSPLILLGDIFATNGAGTEELLWEVAANAIANVKGGMHLLGVAATNGKTHNASGLETRLMAEVGRAVVDKGLTYGQANELISRLLPLYQHTFAQPLFGRPFNEVYDLVRIEPVEEWRRTYEEVKEKLAAMGLF